MPIIFCLLVAWYLVFRVGELFTSTAAKVTAWAADKVAAGAARLGDRGRTLADKATATADTLRNRPTPPPARTRAGEEAAGGGRPTAPAAGGPAAGGAAAGGPAAGSGPAAAAGGGSAPAGGGASAGPAGSGGAADTAGPSTTAPTSDQDSEQRDHIGRLINWLRIVWVDACAAAEAAQERRANESSEGRRWWSPSDSWSSWSGWKASWSGWWGSWTRWPSGNERQAPIKATAERTDRPNENTPAIPSTSDNNVVDAEIVEPEAAALPAPATALPAPATAFPATTAVAAITAGGTAMSVSTDTAPAESGLGSYINYANDMSSSCANAVSSVETTVANMEGHDWSGEPIEALNAAKDLLGQAQAQFDTALTALQSSLTVRDAYGANEHTGDKESVMSD
jgi:hypothetical protein